MSLTLEQLQKNSFGGPYRDRSWSGLTLLDLCWQSHLCHPEWDADTIALYAVTEEPFDPALTVRRSRSGSRAGRVSDDRRAVRRRARRVHRVVRVRPVGRALGA